jgi:predicted regulator of Ras-like GTPase activity (Roadblock/LC7/MglB family)
VAGTGFREALQTIVLKVPEIRYVMVMGTDGIPIDRLDVVPRDNMEAIAAEYTTILRSSVTAAADTGLGGLRELVVVTEGMTAVLMAITPEYFVFACLPPEAGLGRARYVLRVASLALSSEFA